MIGLPRDLRRGLAACGAALVLCLGACAEAPPADRWTDTLARFADEDRQHPPAPGGIVFIGSSSVAGWDLAAAFPDLDTLNRGLGGSRALDLLKRLDRLVEPYRPATVVMYVGDNDVASGRPPEQVVDDVQRLIEGVRDAAPGARLILLAVKPSPARLEFLEPMQRVNAALRSALADDAAIEWVDIHTPMLDEDGRPRPELYDAEDGLHLSRAGYDLWRDLVGPLLARPS